MIPNYWKKEASVYILMLGGAEYRYPDYRGVCTHCVQRHVDTPQQLTSQENIMATALTRKQITDRIYKRMMRAQEKLATSGYETEYRDQALYHDGAKVAYFVVDNDSTGATYLRMYNFSGRVV